ncbi:MAG: hypothetical protein AAF828_06180, partial [Bacteroidota bacterium]
QVCSTNTGYLFTNPQDGTFPLFGATLNTGTNTFTLNTINNDPLFGGQDLATVNGSYFFNVVTDPPSASASLEVVAMDANGQPATVGRLSEDSGIRQDVYGLATADGQTFFILSFDGTNDILQRGTLNPDGTLTITNINTSLPLPPTGFPVAFGTRDGVNFEIIATDFTGTMMLYSATISGNAFNYTLLNADSGAPLSTFGYAAAISRAEILDNGPVCAGERLLLSALNNYPMGGVLNYSWTGPGFTASEQNPAVTDFGAGNAGTYNLTVTFRNGETASCSTTITQAAAGACNTNCDCKEYAYLNDILNDLTHKFEVQPNGNYVEIGSPWLATGIIDEPHGVSIDPNGFLYISSLLDVNVVQLNCDGDVVDAFTEGVGSFNTEVVGNYLFSNGFFSIAPGGAFSSMINTATNEIFIDVFDLCDMTNQRVGRVSLFTPGQTNGDQITSWGMALNPVDGFLYVADNYNNDVGTQFQPNQGDIYRIDPNNPEAPGSVWQLGSQIAPIITGDGLDRVMGITFDNTGAMYVVNQTASSQDTEIRKYTGSGTTWTLAMTATDNLPEFSGYYNGWGITYVETIDELLLTSFSEDCIARINPANLNYIGPAVQHVPGALGKAVDVVTECCYNGPPSITVSACQGETTFLRDEILNCAVCGGDWTVTGGTLGTNDYDDCGQTFTASAATSDQVMFQFTSDNDQCGAVTVNITVNIERPEAVVATTDATCALGATTPTANAEINLTGIMDADVVGISLAGATSYNGPAFGAANGTTLQTVPANGMVNFTGLTHNTNYIVRVFNGSNTCFTDYPQMTNEVVCVCPAIPLVTITEDNINTCGTDAVMFNYTVENGPANLSGGAGTLSTTTLNDGTGSFTYTPGAGESGAVTLTATIPDPDGPGICESSSDAATVTVTPRPVVTLSPDNVDLCGVDVATFTYNVQNGTATISQSGGTGTLSTTSITGTGSFTYTSTATDDGAITITATVAANSPCPAVSDIVTVNVTPRPAISIVEDNINACEDDVATFNYTVENGPTTTFTSDGAGTLAPTELTDGTSTFTYTPVAADGGNTVTITAVIADPDGAGPCVEVSDVATVTVFAQPIVDLVAVTPALCSTDTLVLADIVQTVFDVTVYDFLWSTDGDGTFLDATNTPTFDYELAVAYVPGEMDAVSGGAILTLSSDPATFPPVCDMVSDDLPLQVLKVDCGDFPWEGN